MPPGPPASPSRSPSDASATGSAWAAAPSAALRAAPLLAVLLLAACVPAPPPGTGEPGAEAGVEAGERLSIVAGEFTDLPGWAEDRHAEALPALRASCARFATLPAREALGGDGVVAALAGVAGQWRPVCEAAAALPDADPAQARAFFERHFQPYRAQAGEPWEGRRDGLVTGYYEPEIAGARRRSARAQVPLHGRPRDLVEVDLGRFRPALAGQRIAGRLDGQGQLQPYPSRADIAREGLDGRAPVLAWAESAADAFFLQVQGSGRVRLAEGGTLRLGYAGQNGHPYVPIGRVLVERGEMAREQVSMGSIRAWLAANPDRARALMDENPSYVFFRELRGLAESDGPLGGFGVPLTAGRSVAVDRRHLPLGLPLWLETADPIGGAPIRRIVLAQDVGSAIRGPLRLDLFWGTGAEAGRHAGVMRNPGRFWLLLPRVQAAAQAPSPAPTAAPAGEAPAAPAPASAPASYAPAAGASAPAAPPDTAAPDTAAPDTAAPGVALPLPPLPPRRR
ncbi:MAG: MltA domain-containing protein [Alphaproteobacteria bacterium]|nr:MltA domain-containing protein [Alphaproteobacteria bacterium]